MTNYLIYGKIIVDDIRLKNGSLVRSILGGGGPQAAFGARLWGENVGLLSRSGSDIGKEHVNTLSGLDINLEGWMQYNNIQTPRAEMVYDENEYSIGGGLVSDRDQFKKLLSQKILLPASYKEPHTIHLITEFPEEPMVKTALELKKRGAVLSLEPLIFHRSGHYKDQMLELFSKVDIVTPDWPAASSMAESDNPLDVLRYWSQLGPRLVAIRHGANGSYAWNHEDGNFWHVPIVNIEVVDTTGAGNAYGGGLCVGWGKTEDVRLAGCYASISAAFLVRRYGLPRMATELTEEAFLKLDSLIGRVTLLDDHYQANKA